jgi:hypothetical protein
MWHVVTTRSVKPRREEYIYRMGHLGLSTWHIFCVCQVAKKQHSERFVNFSERRLGEVRLKGVAPAQRAI